MAAVKDLTASPATTARERNVTLARLATAAAGNSVFTSDDDRRPPDRPFHYFEY
jgi:hypothetical protein